jgi:[acyl-carrier-protein] S-malonyltransferase
VGLTDAALAALCADALKACPAVASAGGSLAIANHLFPAGRVLSGHATLVDWVVSNAPTPKYGAMAATKLAVAGAFHSVYMAPAKPTLLAALAETTVTIPLIPVYSNVTAAPYESPEQIKELLAQQLESPVRWEQTIKAMLVPTVGVRSFVDAVPGKQLKSMMARIDKAAFRNTAVLDA